MGIELKADSLPGLDTDPSKDSVLKRVQKVSHHVTASWMWGLDQADVKITLKALWRVILASEFHRAESCVYSTLLSQCRNVNLAPFI